MNPFAIFFLFFVGAPLIELYVLIEVGTQIGALTTILLSIFTAVLGAALVRMAGFSVLIRAQRQLAKREVPAIELMEGATLLLVGVTLLLPGFITDGIGFLLLVTPIRRAFIIWILSRYGIMRPGVPLGAKYQAQRKNSLEGEYRRED